MRDTLNLRLLTILHLDITNYKSDTDTDIYRKLEPTGFLLLHEVFPKVSLGKPMWHSGSAIEPKHSIPKGTKYLCPLMEQSFDRRWSEGLPD